MERERPDPEALPAAQAPARSEQPPAAEEHREKRQAQGSAEVQSAPAPAAPAAKPMMSGRMADAVRAEPPERWVERIIELRKQGKHDEAEKQLAEFRRLHPGYKLPDAALKRE
jgi:hypothetical protein